MTISSTSWTPDSYSGNGSTTTFPITFAYSSETDITVYIVVDSTGVATEQTNPSDYDVDSDDNVEMGTAPATGETIVICRETAQTQAVDLRKGNAFYPETYEGAYDKLTMIIQELWEAIGRAVKFGPTSSSSDIDLPDPEASTILAWNSTPDGLENRTIGIADDNIVEIDDADAADNDFVKFTAYGLEGRSYAETLSDLSGQAASAFDINSQKITSLATPTGDYDAATKKYVDDNILQSNVSTTGTITENDIPRFTNSNTLEGLSYSEFKAALDLEIGTDILAQQTIGIADDNLLEVDGSPSDNDYAKFTANGLEGRSYSEVKADLDLEIDTDIPALVHASNHTDGTDDIQDASTTNKGVSELATDAETITGTDTGKVTTPANIAAVLAARKLDDLATPDDNTDLNATNAYHGLLQKLDDDTSHFLRGDGAWAAPSSGAGEGDLLADGTVPLTANWDVGAYKITALQFESDIATGTAPLIVASTTVVSNLNADLLDGNEAAAFVPVSSFTQDSGILVGTGAGTFAEETGATLRTSLGLAIGTDVLAEQTIGIANDNLVEVDGTPVDGEVTVWTAAGLDSKSEAEFKELYNLEIGTDVLAQQTIGIANDNLLEVDDADAADNDYAKFTAAGLEGRSYQEMSTDMFSTVLAENTQILFDPALSADGKWNGISRTGTAGTNLAFGDVVYFAVADSKWELIDADAEATIAGLAGICVVAGNENAAVTIMTYGVIRADAAFPALTIGAPVFAGTTAGDIVVTAPSGSSDCIRVMGQAITANSILFNPSQDWIELVA